MHDLPGARRVAGLWLMALLAGCSSGGGGDESTGTEISTNAISFSAAAPDAATPTSQAFTATFGSDIAHLAVVHSGAAISTVTTTMNGRTATVTIQPVEPASVGPGAFVGAVAVTGYTCADATCSKLAAGTTSTVSVSYQVSPVVQFVAPYVAAAGVSEEVVIRGVGFRSFNVQGVRFGDNAATSFTLVTNSSTEIRATHPALAAGLYVVRLDATDHQGEIPSTAVLRVVDPTAYAATTLPYPTAPTALRSLIYDAERRVLLALTDAAGGSIVRYPYTGTAWGTPSEVPVGLRDMAFSAKGTSLYGITSTTLLPLDPVTLAATGTEITAPSLTTDAFLKNIVVGNDDIALITTGINAATSTTPYFYSPFSGTLLQTGTLLNNATPGMSAIGATAYISQGDPTATSDLVVYKYSVAGNALGTSAISQLQNAVPPVLSRRENRLVLNGTRVYDGAEAYLGGLGTSTAVVMNREGTRAYTYDPTAGGILTYDISVDRDEAAYEALGPATPLAGDPGSGVRMVISPDDRTLFVAGSSRIVVQPTPAL